MSIDIRWKQRLDNFERAFGQLREAVQLRQERPLSRLEEQGLIQAFEYTHELAWKTLKDFLEGRGAGKLYGSRDATRAAFREGLVTQGQTWMDMIVSRNLTSHAYDEAMASEVAEAIVKRYYPEFVAFSTAMGELAAGEPG